MLPPLSCVCAFLAVQTAAFRLHRKVGGQISQADDFALENVSQNPEGRWRLFPNLMKWATSGRSNETGNPGRMQPNMSDMQPEPRIEPSQPILIIFDWDDTLLPTTRLVSQKVSAVPYPRSKYAEESILHPSVLAKLREIQTVGDESMQQNTAEQNRKLRALETQVRAVLTKAASIGHTAIVTNGQSGWVEYSCWNWAPRVAPLLGSSVQVLSARPLSAPANPDAEEVKKWKGPAFQSVKDQMEKDHGVVFKEVISIGDAEYEQIAAIQLAEKANEQKDDDDADTFYAKSVKLIRHPSIEQLQAELVKVEQKLETIVAMDGDKRLSISPS